MWIYKAISDFGPIKFRNVKKLSHSLFSIKNKKEKKKLFSAKANMENNMTTLVNSTLKAVRWEFKQHTMIIWSRLASTITIHGNSTHFETKTSMIRDIPQVMVKMTSQFVLWFQTAKCKCRDYMCQSLIKWKRNQRCSGKLNSTQGDP